MDYFEHKNRLDHQKQAEVDGRVADSMDVRLALIERMHRGELTLEEVQSQLAAIRRKAKGNGQVTRAQAYRGL